MADEIFANATIDTKKIKALIRRIKWRKPVKTDLNRDFALTIGDSEELTPCRVNYIQQDGRINLVGDSPEIRALMNKGTRFFIKRRDGEVFVSATVMRVEEVEVLDVVADDPDESGKVQNELTLLCLLDKCTFFEPLEI